MNEINKMNQLAALELGYASVVTPANVTEEKVVVTRITEPTKSSNINIAAIGCNDDKIVEFTFTNNTGATQTLYFSALFGTVGSHAAYNLPASAVDFATFLEDTSDFPANGGIVQGFNKGLMVQPLIVGVFRIQTTSITQSNQKLTSGRLSFSNQKIECSIFPTLCDACPNNNSDAFTKEFRGNFPLGGRNYLAYKILAGVTVTIQMEIIGAADVHSFVAV